MDTEMHTWVNLFTTAGLLNPLTWLISGYLGWRADQKAKILIAAFAGAVLSLLFETAWVLLHLPPLVHHNAGALAMFPFRFFGGLIVAFAAWTIARRRRGL